VIEVDMAVMLFNAAIIGATSSFSIDLTTYKVMYMPRVSVTLNALKKLEIFLGCSHQIYIALD
jgi:hypothetical protein